MEQETTMTREKILYDAAVQLMREADDVETYRLAEKLFRRIPQWKERWKRQTPAKESSMKFGKNSMTNGSSSKRSAAAARAGGSRRLCCWDCLTVVTVALLHVRRDLKETTKGGGAALALQPPPQGMV